VRAWPWILAGCSAKAAPIRQPVEATGPPPAPLVVPAGRSEVRWPELSLSFVALDGAPVERKLWPEGGGVASQTLIGPGEAEYVSWRVRTAAGESLRTFETEHADWTRSGGETLALCGQDVQVQVARRAEQDIECIITTTGNHPGRNPPSVAFAVAVPHGNVTVYAEFQVSSDHFDVWEPVAHELLGSLRCL
jgi:hypothetical protein